MSAETDHLEGFWGRINHPVFGVFASTWVIINWELVYTLVRGLEDVKTTINQINTVYLNSARFDFLLLKPILVTVAFLFLAPILRQGYSLWKEFVEKGKQWVSQMMDKLQPVPKWQHKSLEVEKDRLANDLNTMRQVLQLVDPNMKTAAVLDQTRLDENVTIRMELPQLIGNYNALVKTVKNLSTENNKQKVQLQQAVQRYEHLFPQMVEMKLKLDQMYLRDKK